VEIADNSRIRADKKNLMPDLDFPQFFYVNDEKLGEVEFL